MRRRTKQLFGSLRKSRNAGRISRGVAEFNCTLAGLVIYEFEIRGGVVIEMKGFRAYRGRDSSPENSLLSGGKIP
jgi:hypothetical protein